MSEDCVPDSVFGMCKKIHRKLLLQSQDSSQRMSEKQCREHCSVEFHLSFNDFKMIHIFLSNVVIEVVV